MRTGRRSNTSCQQKLVGLVGRDIEPSREAITKHFAFFAKAGLDQPKKFFAIGFNIPLANWGTPKWVLALNFLLREWKRSSLEYRTGRARSEWASMRSTAASATGWLC